MNKILVLNVIKIIMGFEKNIFGAIEIGDHFLCYFCDLVLENAYEC